MASQHRHTRFKNMTVEIGDLVVNGTTSGGLAGTAFLDDAEALFGTDEDAALLWSTGDASNEAAVLALGNTSQALHVTDYGAKATDWNVSGLTHPTVFVHSNTTPATDYMTIGGHDGTTGAIDVVGGTTLALKIGGTAEVTVDASNLDLASTNLKMQAAGKILDDNGNELVIFAEMTSAVNELTITNAATGNPALITASGETDVGIAIAAKGAGYTRVTTGGLQVHSVAAVTATTGGGGTGLIPAGTTFCVVTSDSADKSISLPAATVGDRIRILIGATGCELISSVAGHKVNDVVVGATNEAALVATSLYDCWYVATNTWVVLGYTKLGAVAAALVPDALA